MDALSLRRHPSECVFLLLCARAHISCSDLCVCVSLSFVSDSCVCVCVLVAHDSCVCVLVAQLCLTLSDRMGCSLPGSPVHGILQASIPERVAMPSSLPLLAGTPLILD